MRVTLLHNPTAGNSAVDRAELLGAFRDAGVDARYHSTKNGDVGRVLRDPGDLVVIAGGDGAVGKVALHHVHRDVPLAIFPLGTSNNVARTFGIDGNIATLLPRMLESARAERTRPLDVARARTARGSRDFIESAGIGLVARLIHDAESAKKTRGTAEVRDGWAHLLDALESARPRWCLVEADGRDLSGEYLLVEAMNLPSVGPRVSLAPDADPGDGKLDLVLMSPDDRETLVGYVGDLMLGAPTRPPLLRSHRVHSVRMQWDPSLGHVDDEPWPASREPTHVEVVVGDADPVRIVVP